MITVAGIWGEILFTITALALSLVCHRSAFRLHSESDPLINFSPSFFAEEYGGNKTIINLFNSFLKNTD